MNKLILSGVLLLSSFAVSAQIRPAEGKAAVIYSLPKVKLCIEADVDKIVRKPGPFYRYSDRYLATNNVITSEKTEYKLRSVRIVSVAVPDTSRTFMIPAETKSGSHITLNERGILVGVNVDCPVKSTDETLKSQAVADALPVELYPLGEEYMMAGSESKMAEGIARQIYRIRESRLGLCTADVDKIPSDGESLKTMLEGLDKMEHKLSALFVGSIHTETMTTRLYVDPREGSNDVLFRFSGIKGLLSPDDLSGSPFYINVKTSGQVMISAPKEKSPAAELYSVLPVDAIVAVTDGANVVARSEVQLPQFGKLVPVPDQILKQSNVKIIFDSTTGRLVSVK